MLTKIYYWLHKFFSRQDEKDEYSGGLWQNKIRQKALAILSETAKRALEIGCGEGLFLVKLAQARPDLDAWGIDNNRERLEQAEKKGRQNNLNNVHFLFQEAPNIAFEDDYFDAVVCVNVFFNMPSIEMVKDTLKQAKRVCKNGGRIIFDFRSSVNPLLRLKYRLARYYDKTVVSLPLQTYWPGQIELILKELGLDVISRSYLEFPLKQFAPVILIEARK